MGNIDIISDEGILNSKNPRLFAEKFFIPFTENESINLAFKSGEHKIFVINNNSGQLMNFVSMNINLNYYCQFFFYLTFFL